MICALFNLCRNILLITFLSGTDLIYRAALIKLISSYTLHSLCFILKPLIGVLSISMHYNILLVRYILMIAKLVEIFQELITCFNSLIMINSLNFTRL